MCRRVATIPKTNSSAHYSASGTKPWDTAAAGAIMRKARRAGLHDNASVAVARISQATTMLSDAFMSSRTQRR